MVTDEVHGRYCWQCFAKIDVIQLTFGICVDRRGVEELRTWSEDSQFIYKRRKNA